MSNWEDVTEEEELADFFYYRQLYSWDDFAEKRGLKKSTHTSYGDYIISKWEITKD